MSDAKTLGQIGFEAYGEHAGWTAYDGKPMPRWDENLRPDIKEKWEVAAMAIKAEVVNRLKDDAPPPLAPPPLPQA